jgi:phospholipid/cholesterol/gamma-HCH transport system permease protein
MPLQEAATMERVMMCVRTDVRWRLFSGTPIALTISCACRRGFEASVRARPWSSESTPATRQRLLRPLLTLNEGAKRAVHAVQGYFVLAWNAVRFIVARPFYGRDIIQQMDSIGVQSLGIVLLTGFFTGMVLALQFSVQMAQFGATMYMGRLVTASMVRELGPVLAGLMVAGRVGSGIAAELGSMRVTEQIDALNTLGTDPIKKLVTPRLLAALVMMPVLTILSDLVGIFGGNVIATLYVGIPTSLYWRTVWEQIAAGGFVLRYVPTDFLQGLLKPLVFGGVIAITGCFFGLSTTGGTEGVGRSTTRTVVTASVLILTTDYFMTQLLLYILP